MLDLTRIPWRSTRHEGIHLHFLRRDAATGDATVLIRMEPGCSYPAHRHNGVEEVFILQGGYRDARGTYRAGDYVLNEAGSAHEPTALTDPTEDCIMLAVAHGGIETQEP
ncbi:MAG TPA: cupin domain-containing protein [Pyrinomonadaceae bacterium]|jgi:anti-sigma factor ChrR (cupin superfamily)|nr:cupin domain-containing protein [Pyrinomonadaceae bacterium]